MKTHYLKKSIYLLALSLLTASCVKTNKIYQPKETLTIDYEVPHDLAENATPEDIAVFAWNEFFALNWKAAWTESDQTRTTPDKTWSLASGGAQPELSVWETYIHRIELRPANGQRTADLSTGTPNYTFINADKVNSGANPIDLSQYWNVLDEDNEIASAYLFAHENEKEVMYMAKSNLLEYNYIKDHFSTDTELYAAAAKISNLDSVNRVAHFKALGKKGLCASDSLTNAGYICLPCGEENNATDEGAIEIKMAFRKLTTADDTSRFMTKEVVTFTNKVVNGEVEYIPTVEVFGVIGMHIIHKTKNHPTFVLASWEQVDVRNADMQTIGLDDVIVNGKKHEDVDPHRLNPVIERVIPETIQAVNKEAIDLIVSVNPASKWQYYQLIGAQANPVDYKNRNGDNNYFMANYVIESDLTLTNFHGSFADPFNPAIQNVTDGNLTYNMGGCMGCHGQAQKKGNDFSFLLDNVGKPVPEPDLYQTYDQALFSAAGKIPYTINSKSGFQNTGILVENNKSLTLIYKSGLWTADPHQNNGQLYDAAGYKNHASNRVGYPIPSANIGALVGKIGDNPPFLVGDGVVKTPAGQLGFLKLSINDDLEGIYGSGLSDNIGSIQVEIKR